MYTIPLAERCHNCGTPIAGKIVRADGRCFHQHCYQCSACRQNLIGKAARPGNNGEFLCHSCDRRCARCQQPVHMNGLQVENMLYHPMCLACVHCGVPVNEFTGDPRAPTCLRCSEVAHCMRCRATVHPRDMCNANGGILCRHCAQDARGHDGRRTFHVGHPTSPPASAGMRGRFSGYPDISPPRTNGRREATHSSPRVSNRQSPSASSPSGGRTRSPASPTRNREDATPKLEHPTLEFIPSIEPKSDATLRELFNEALTELRGAENATFRALDECAISYREVEHDMIGLINEVRTGSVRCGEAKTKLALLEARLNKLQTHNIDSICLAELPPRPHALGKSIRKDLTGRVDSLLNYVESVFSILNAASRHA